MNAPSFPRNAVALLVGIGKYQRADRIAGLQYAYRDARALAKLLRDQRICGFPEDRVVLLTDARARRSSIARRLSQWLPREAHGAELVLIYFACHGTVASIGSHEEGYLLPYDADPDNIVGQGIAMGDVARWIDALDARSVVVCLDCCHAGGILPAAGMSLRTSSRDMQIRPSILQRLGGQGRFLIASCDRGQKSIETDELRHGLFTYHLLQGLRGAGDRDGDGCVRIAELFSYVSSSVSRDARERFQREQTPWTWATYNEDPIVSVVPVKTVPSGSTVHNEATSEEQLLLQRLQHLRRQPDVHEIPFLFRNLAHRDSIVRQFAQKALSALAWDLVVAQAESFARGNDPHALEDLFLGLEALESHSRVIALLDRLATLLRDKLRDRALWLLDRKRLAQERERLAGIFHETNSIYEMVKVLGPGTYTGAYLARQQMTGLEVVVRVLRAEFAQQPLIRSHFLELGTKAVRFVHQNLVLTREVRSFPERALFYTVRDFVRGVTLREVLASGRRFEPLQACKILRQVVDALGPLHRETLVHAGIKPSNIFLTADDQVILGDPSLPLATVGLDVARLAYDFRYAPPELFRPGGELGITSDFYSLGCVAFELFQGQPPFLSDSPFELVSRHDRDSLPPLHLGSFTPWLDAWIRPLLAKSPQQRFANLDQVRLGLKDLERALRGGAPPPNLRLSAPGAPLRPDTKFPKVQKESVPGLVEPLDSIPLLHEESLQELQDRQSIIPLTHADGSPVSGSMDHSPLSQSPLSPTPLPGYEILQELGRGGMGVVYKARQVSLNRIVALKMILGGEYAGLQQRQRFLLEAKAVAAISHPGIVQVFELGMHEGLPFVALEFCSGGSLAQKLSGTPLPPKEAALLLERIARAVQAAHDQSIVHRDLKPANILLDAGGQPKVSDFGLARRLEGEDHLTHTGAVMGTPSYMAPEQAQGKREIGPATDIYSLGAILYECLTGRPPFRGANLLDTLNEVVTVEPVSPRKLNPLVPRVLESICLTCLQKDPRHRYATAGAFADDLNHFLKDQPTPTANWAHASAQPAKSWKRWWPFGRK